MFETEGYDRGSRVLTASIANPWKKKKKKKDNAACLDVPKEQQTVSSSGEKAYECTAKGVKQVEECRASV